jgi:adenylate cyclase class IV
MPIEVEERAMFSREEHDRLMAFLLAHATDLGRDNRRIHWFPLDGGHLKVSDAVDQGKAKIAYKGGAIGGDSTFRELEISISRDQIDQYVALFQALGLGGLYHESPNDRHNFEYLGVEIALKYSEAWGHHAELEILLDDGATADQITAAKAKIRQVADKLQVHIMTPEELRIFEAQFREAQAAKS